VATEEDTNQKIVLLNSAAKAGFSLAKMLRLCQASDELAISIDSMAPALDQF
jgi:hypothetical protein